jgi:hypothetical protein
MNARSDSTKQIWVTECGWPTYTNSSDPNAVSFDVQAQYLTNLFTRLASYPYVRAVMWYNLRSFDETQKEGSFGLLLLDFTKKPSFDGFKQWTTAASMSCPPRIQDISLLPNGNVHLDFIGTTGFVYGIQCSTGLATWQSLVTNLPGSNGVYSFEDPDAVNASARFYRVVWP